VSTRKSPADRSIPVETTWRVRDHCLCLATQRAARALARRFDNAFRDLNLTSGQFSLLMSLNRPVPPPLGAVAEVLAMDRTTLTANLKPLTKRHLIATKVDPRDKRSRLLKLTPAGEDLLNAAIPIWERVQKDLERRLTKGDANSLRAGLLDLA
jgi:DNA-binding MarR family transcriptional regulator